MVNKFFAKQISKNVEAYANDIVVKSEKTEDYVVDLKKVFEVLSKFGVKLNLEKCVFKVAKRKFFGFMVS